MSSSPAKGGVGKTSLSCAFAIFLADAGKRVLLISTDPASNLDELLEGTLSSRPIAVPGVAGLSAMNINPLVVAQEYRERLVGPYRALLPAAAVKSIEEQLSGACATEIAAFEAFAKLLGGSTDRSEFDHVIFDTAPTGHTLRLLKLPGAWDGFLAKNPTGTSCLGPLGGLQAQKVFFSAMALTLADPTKTLVVLVARPDSPSLKEAERTRIELVNQGVVNQHLVLNGVYPYDEGYTPKAPEAARVSGVLLKTPDTDPLAKAMIGNFRKALEEMPDSLRRIPNDRFPLIDYDIRGLRALRAFSLRQPEVPEKDIQSGPWSGSPPTHGFVPEQPKPRDSAGIPHFMELSALIFELAQQSRGVIMTMGKGGVGKTSIAGAIALGLAHRGHAVHLTTTDPAAHNGVLLPESTPNLKVSRIDPEVETYRHRSEVMQQAGTTLDQRGRDLLEEDLRSPCTEEIAVFKAFARIVAEGQDGFVVLDTAPTGHTLLLLDAAEAYHREVSRNTQETPDAVRSLRPRLRDPGYTKVLIVTLPEATPVHEAAALQCDLKRAGIIPYAWVVNQSLAACLVTDPFLLARQTTQESRCLWDCFVAVAPRNDKSLTRSLRAKRSNPASEMFLKTSSRFLGTNEVQYLREVRETQSEKAVIVPWLANPSAESLNIPFSHVDKPEITGYASLE